MCSISHAALKETFPLASDVFELNLFSDVSYKSTRAPEIGAFEYSSKTVTLILTAQGTSAAFNT